MNPNHSEDKISNTVHPFSGEPNPSKEHQRQKKNQSLFLKNGELCVRLFEIDPFDAYKLHNLCCLHSYANYNWNRSDCSDSNKESLVHRHLCILDLSIVVVHLHKRCNILDSPHVVWFCKHSNWETLI